MKGIRSMEAKSIDDLLDDARSDDSERQYQAARLLIGKRHHAAVPALLPLMTSSDEMVRYMAARALGELGGRDADVVGPALMRSLDDEDEGVRNQAAEALGSL